MVPNAEHSLANQVPSVLFGIRAFALSIIMVSCVVLNKPTCTDFRAFGIDLGIDL